VEEEEKKLKNSLTWKKVKGYGEEREGFLGVVVAGRVTTRNHFLIAPLSACSMSILTLWFSLNIRAMFALSPWDFFPCSSRIFCSLWCCAVCWLFLSSRPHDQKVLRDLLNMALTSFNCEPCCELSHRTCVTIRLRIDLLIRMA
jgi:hypothetical protein